MIAGIVGHEALKFTPATEAMAREVITQILEQEDITAVSSGRCHLGGIDVWAEEIALELGKYNPDLIFPPKNQSWEKGYKPRNIQIAEASDIVHVIVIERYPQTYTGMRFKYCYHCDTTDHIKSGGCWTANYAMKLGKPAKWHVISEDLK